MSAAGSVFNVNDEAVQDIIKSGGHKISALEVERVSALQLLLLLGLPLLSNFLNSRLGSIGASAHFLSCSVWHIRC
jgi:hypothetical protein